MVVSLFLVLNSSIGVSVSTNYDRQEEDACITISKRPSVKGGSETDFYVTPSGEAVPATGYRYMDSKKADDAFTKGE